MGKVDAVWWANIPLAEFRGAFQLSDDDFLQTYNATKPEITDDVILQCRSGNTKHIETVIIICIQGARSKVAQYMLADIGYKNSKNFEGGYLLYRAKLMAEKTHEEWRKNHPVVTY